MVAGGATPLVALAEIVFSFLLEGCDHPSARISNPAPATGSPLQVTVVAVESEKLDTTLSLPAQITSYEVVDIYPKVTGFLDTISVDRGSPVHAGELIIRLSGTYQHLKVAAETPGVVAGNDLQVAEQTAAADKVQMEAASKSVQAAQSALRGATQLESYLEIRAPFDGVVTQRNLHPGALVGLHQDRQGHTQSFRLRISAGCVW
jgi:membrane fusion protein (multidrug efflux system)